MGSQFGWFYDVIAAAIVLICIFIGSKKGGMKSAFGFVGIAIAAVLSFALSDAVSQAVGGDMVNESNAKKISQSIDSDTFTNMYADYLADMGYGLQINTGKLGNALDSNENIDEAVVKYINNMYGHSVDKKEVLLEKIREGYAVVISDIVSRSLNKYASETAGALIRNDSSGMDELIPLLRDSERDFDAAMYISENYVAPAYDVMGRLISFLILFGISALAFVFGISAFLGKRDVDAIGVVSHVVGGVFGILSAVALVFAVAVGVRLSAVTGDNAMLFFNNDVVDKSYVFKYFYEFAMKM